MDRPSYLNRSSAVSALAEEIGAPVIDIANLGDLIDYLEQAGSHADILGQMQVYRDTYCVV